MRDKEQRIIEIINEHNPQYGLYSADISQYYGEFIHGQTLTSMVNKGLLKRSRVYSEDGNYRYTACQINPNDWE